MSATSIDPHLPETPAPRSRPQSMLAEAVEADMLLEQAKGALIFRYAVDAGLAQAILEGWGAESGEGVEAVADALVRGVCQGDVDAAQEPWLTRWVEDRLRREPHQLRSRPVAATADRNRSEPVRMLVDQSQASLDAVVAAAREARRLDAPLELAMVTCWSDSTPAAHRAQVLSRLDLAAQVARCVAPGVEVRTEVGHSGRDDS
ncbi:MAG: hypothetical protein ACLGH4_01845 [Actinomycetes bacterium]